MVDHAAVNRGETDSAPRTPAAARYGKNGATDTLTIDGQRLELLRVGDDVYIKGSTSFWTTFADTLPGS